MTIKIANHVAKFEIIPSKMEQGGFHIRATYEDGSKTLWDAMHILTERGAKARLTRARNQYRKQWGVEVK